MTKASRSFALYGSIWRFTMLTIQSIARCVRKGSGPSGRLVERMSGRISVIWNVQLKQHLMDHGGQRPYPCPECSFTCKTKQQLNEHRRKHSVSESLTISPAGSYYSLQGEKAYSCPLCGTRFTYRNGLIKHTKLNRCPKKISTSEGEKLMKKKSKSGDHINRHKVERLKGLDSKLEVWISA